MSTRTRDHAVVLGGGLAGLFAARVLADTYSTVTIVERDRLPFGPVHRPGVTQARHVHALLPRGRQIAEELFPGWTSELIDAGGLPGDILGNVRWLIGGGQLRQARTGLTVVSASRPLIEYTTRRRVLAQPNVRLLDGYDIVGLSISRTGNQIVGARVSSRYGEGSQVLPASLVVDCTGRGSRAARWLSELGYAAPPADRMAIDVSYATRLFDLPPAVFGDDIVVTVRAPGQLHGGVMQRLENGQSLVTLIGLGGERPPVELTGFAAFAGELADPDIHQAVQVGRPLDAGATFRMPAAVRYRYETLTDLPAGLLVAGDAVCALNPVYAQGMSVAAASMLVLQDVVHAAVGGDPDPLRYYAAVARLVDPAWAMAVAADSAIPGVVAPPVAPSALPAGYLPSLQRAAVADVELARAFTRVASLIDPPSALLRPDIAHRVQRAAQPVA